MFRCLVLCRTQGEDEETAERRARWCADQLDACEVKLVVAAEDGARVADWGLRSRYEAVGLHTADPFGGDADR